MKRIIKYKEFVNVDGIKVDNEHKYRLMLEITLSGGEKNKSALVIMQNPSKATETVSDQTVNRVLDLLHNFKYEKVYIANLIPFYATDSAKVAKKAELEDNLYVENDSIICEKVNSVSKIFVAWGGRNKFSNNLYKSRVKAIREIIGDSTAYCYCVNKNGTPRHPSRNGWKIDAAENEFIEYVF